MLGNFNAKNIFYFQLHQFKPLKPIKIFPIKIKTKEVIVSTQIEQDFDFLEIKKLQDSISP